MNACAEMVIELLYYYYYYYHYYYYYYYYYYCNCYCYYYYAPYMNVYIDLCVYTKLQDNYL